MIELTKNGQMGQKLTIKTNITQTIEKRNYNPKHLLTKSRLSMSSLT